MPNMEFDASSDKAQNELNKMIAANKQLEKAVDQLAKTASKGAKAYETAVKDANNELIKQQKHQKELERDAKKLYEETRTGAEKAAAKQKRLNELLKAGKIDVETYNRGIAQTKAELAAQEAAVKGVNKELEKQKKRQEELEREAKKVYEETRTGAEKAAAKQKRLNELYKAGKIDLDTYKRGMQQLQDEIDEANDGVEESGTGFKNMSTTAKTALAAVGTAITSYIINSLTEAIEKQKEYNRELAGAGMTSEDHLRRFKVQAGISEEKAQELRAGVINPIASQWAVREDQAMDLATQVSSSGIDVEGQNFAPVMSELLQFAAATNQQENTAPLAKAVFGMLASQGKKPEEITAGDIRTITATLTDFYAKTDTQAADLIPLTQKTGASMAEYGMSLNESLAFQSMLVDKFSMPPEVASTAVDRMVSLVHAPTMDDNARAALEERFGSEFIQQLNVREHGAPQVFATLDAGLKQVEPGERDAFIKQIFGEFYRGAASATMQNLDIVKQNINRGATDEALVTRASLASEGRAAEAVKIDNLTKQLTRQETAKQTKFQNALKLMDAKEQAEGIPAAMRESWREAREAHFAMTGDPEASLNAVYGLLGETHDARQGRELFGNRLPPEVEATERRAAETLRELDTGVGVHLPGGAPQLPRPAQIPKRAPFDYKDTQFEMTETEKLIKGLKPQVDAETEKMKRLRAEAQLPTSDKGAEISKKEEKLLEKQNQLLEGMMAQLELLNQKAEKEKKTRRRNGGEE